MMTDRDGLGSIFINYPWKLLHVGIKGKALNSVTIRH